MHEMVRRSASPGKWGSTANLLAVCRQCHSTVVVNMPLSMQLAHKLLHDPDTLQPDNHVQNSRTQDPAAGRGCLPQEDHVRSTP